MPVEAFASSDSVRLHYLDWGGTGKPLVLLAGLGGTAQHYRGLAPRLAKRFRVVGLTRRGHGRSDLPNSGYDLDTLVEDIRRFLDALAVEKANLVGHSFAGFEMPRLALRYPQRVDSIVFLDALFPRLDPEPDLSGDPVAPLLPTGPTPDDLASRDAYLAYYKRARPDWARIWCEAIEANVMDYVRIDDGGHMVFHHDDELMNRILEDLWPRRDPRYERVAAPMLAIVPDGNTHQSLPLDPTDELRLAADRYWATKILPWIRQRTAVFRQAAPTARVVELDTPSHHVFIAREDETVAAIGNFLEG